MRGSASAGSMTRISSTSPAKSHAFPHERSDLSHWRKRLGDKLDRLLAESLRRGHEIATSGDSVCAVARRHGLSPQQLFGWRRQLRDSEAERSEADGLQFVPAVVAVGSSPVPQRRAPRCKAEASAGTIEVEINGVTVRGGRGADAKTLMAVLRALKAGA